MTNVSLYLLLTLTLTVDCSRLSQTELSHLRYTHHNVRVSTSNANRCAGTRIYQYIVTSASCLRLVRNNTNIKVRFWDNTISNPTVLKPHQNFKGSSEGQFARDDIAVLEDPTNKRTHLFRGQILRTRLGKIDKLSRFTSYVAIRARVEQSENMELRIPERFTMFTNDTCRHLLGPLFDSQSMLCGQGREHHLYTCAEDVGTALYHLDEHFSIQILGVHTKLSAEQCVDSSGKPIPLQVNASTPIPPLVFTKISAFRNFLDQLIPGDKLWKH